MIARALLLSLLAAACACGPTDAADYGARLFTDPALSTGPRNVFSCATCHSVGDPPGTLAGPRIDPGFSLTDAAHRASFWGGDHTGLLPAVNACVTLFMNGTPLPATSDESRSLYEFLLRNSPNDEAPALPLTVPALLSTLPRGDPTAGEKIWQRACASCHGATHTGFGRIGPGASIVPEASIEFAARSGFGVDLVLVEKVRHGSFFGIGGVMPPFPVEQLSDADLSALLGYLVPLD